MLGITTPDAIALGTLILAFLAWHSGRKAGDAAKKAYPPPVTPLSLGMATFADTAMMGQLVAAVDKLSATIASATAERARNEREEVKDRLEELADKLDRMTDRPGRR